MLRTIPLALCVIFATTAYAAQFEAQFSGAVFDADSKGSPAIEGVTLEALPALEWNYRDGEVHRQGRIDVKVAGTARSGEGGTFVLKLVVTYDETKLPKPLEDLRVDATLRGSKGSKLGIWRFTIWAGMKSTVTFAVYTTVRVSGQAMSLDGKTPLTGEVRIGAFGFRDLYSSKLEADGSFKVTLCPGLYYELRVGDMEVTHPLLGRQQVFMPRTDTDLGPVRFAKPGTLMLDFEGVDLGRNGVLYVELRHEGGLSTSVTVSADRRKFEQSLPPGSVTVSYASLRDYRDVLEFKRVIVSDEVQWLYARAEMPRDVVLTGVELDYYTSYGIKLTAESGQSYSATRGVGADGKDAIMFRNVPALAATYTVAGYIGGYEPFSFQIELKPEMAEIKLSLIKLSTLKVNVKDSRGNPHSSEIYVAPKGNQFAVLFATEGLESAQKWVDENDTEFRKTGGTTGYSRSKIPLPAGEYFVLAFVYSEYLDDLVPLSGYVTVAAGEAMELELRQQTTKATLILTRDGKPVANEKAGLFREDWFELKATSETDENGRVEFAGLVPGSYVVIVEQGMFFPEHKDHRAELAFRTIKHGTADAEYKVDLSYRVLCELTLTLELPSDQLIQTTLRSTATDEYGRAQVFQTFEVAGTTTTLEPMLLPPGDYTLDASRMVDFGVHWPLFSEKFSVSAGTQALKLAPKLRSISGRVELGGLKGVKETTVSLIAWDEFGENYTRELTFGAEVKPDGSFMLTTVPIAEFTIQATVELEDGTTALAFMDGNGHDGPFTATLKPEVRKGRLVVSFESPHRHDVVVLQYRVPGGTWARPGLDARLEVSRKHEAIHLDGLPLGDIELRGIGLGCELPPIKVKVEATTKLVSMTATATERIWFAVDELPDGVDPKGTVIELLDSQGKVLLRDTHRFNSNWSTMRDSGDSDDRSFVFRIKLLTTAAASVRITFPGCNPVTAAVAPQPEDEYGEPTPHYIEVTKK